MPGEAVQKRREGCKFTRTFMFFKEKYIDGIFDKVKGRFVNMDTFAHPDDNPNVASPTPSVESVNSVIADAAEHGKEIAKMDVGGAFLNAKAGDLNKYLEIDKSIVDILLRLKPE